MGYGERVAAPHLRQERTTDQLMTEVLVALVPPAAGAVWYFGWAAAVRLLLAVAASAAAGRLCGRVFDPAALITGVLLCLSCPAGLPVWLLIAGCFGGVWLFREGFGGLGRNRFNPAMAARGLMLVLCPALFAGGVDGVTSPTPLARGDWALFAGAEAGSLGETSVVLTGLGLLWLLTRRVVSPLMPVGTLLGCGAVNWLAGAPVGPALLSGGLLFACVYIVTDPVTCPVTPAGRAVFAMGVGALTAGIRLWGPYPEGVCFAVLLMNGVAPALEFVTLRRRSF